MFSAWSRSGKPVDGDRETFRKMLRLGSGSGSREASPEAAVMEVLGFFRLLSCSIRGVGRQRLQTLQTYALWPRLVCERSVRPKSSQRPQSLL